MATRRLTVEIVGDERGLKRSLDRSQKGMSKFGAVAKKAAAGGALAAGGLAVGFKKVTDAAAEAEKSQARLKAQLNASGISFRQHSGEIERVIQKTSRLAALDDEDLQDAFTNIVRTTGDVNRSLRLTGVAADFARGKQIDVAKAGELVAKVAGGNTGILSRYGVTIEKGASASQALAALQRKFAGQAEAYGRTSAGAQDRLRVSAENLQEAIGAKLAPVLARITNRITDFINGMVKGTGAGGRFREAMTGLAGTVQRIVSAVAPVVGALGAFTAKLAASKVGMTVLATVAGGLAARIVALKVASAAAAAMSLFTRALAAARVVLLALRAPLLTTTLLMRANPFVAAATAIGALGAALVVAYKKSETFRRIVDGAFSGVKAAFRAVVAAVRTGVAFILRLYDKWLGGFSSILSAAGKIPGIGGKFRAAARGIDEARERLRGVADAIEGVRKKKDTRVTVRTTIDLAISGKAKKLVPLTSLPSGDPRGIEKVLAMAGHNAGVGYVNALPALQTLSGGAGGKFTGGTYKHANAIARRFGLRISSGYRSPAHNRAVGGVPNSLHTHGSPSNPGAIDLVGPFGAMQAGLIYAKQKIKGLKEALVHDAGSGLHLHLGFFRKGGIVPGRGDGDKVPVMAEPGEGFINKKAVAALGGKAAIDTINRALPRFQKGGVAGVISAARGAGFKGNLLRIMAAVAMGESGGNPRARGDGGQSHGLWQIYRVAHPWARSLNLFNPAVNAKAAMRVYRSQGLGAWTVYRKGIYRRHLGAVDQALKGGGGGRSPGRRGGGGGGLLTGRLQSTDRRPGDPPESVETISGMLGRQQRGRPSQGLHRVPRGEATEGPAEASPAGPSLADFIDARLAQAGLTANNADDLEALREMQRLRQEEYRLARESGDPRRVAETANALRQVNSEIDQMEQAARDAEQAVREAAKAFRINSLNAALAQAQLTKGTEDDIAALEKLLQLRREEYESLVFMAEEGLGGGVDQPLSDPGQIADAADAFRQAQDALEQAKQAEQDRARQLIEDTHRAALAQAQLTEGTDDDIAATQALLALREQEYAAALAANDPARIADTATELRNVRDSLAQLNTALEDARKAAEEAAEEERKAREEHTAALKDLKESMDRANEFSASISAINAREAMKFVGDVMQEVGGRSFAQRRRTAGDGYTLART